jgi:DNA-binding NarL/FixJ family response regulator
MGIACWCTRFTRREVEVLSLIAIGATNTTMARRLRVHPSTIARHIEHALKKAGAGTRAELVARAYAHGMLLSAQWPPASRADDGGCLLDTLN